MAVAGPNIDITDGGNTGGTKTTQSTKAGYQLANTLEDIFQFWAHHDDDLGSTSTSFSTYLERKTFEGFTSVRLTSSSSIWGYDKSGLNDSWKSNKSCTGMKVKGTTVSALAKGYTPMAGSYSIWETLDTPGKYRITTSDTKLIVELDISNTGLGSYQTIATYTSEDFWDHSIPKYLLIIAQGAGGGGGSSSLLWSGGGGGAGGFGSCIIPTDQEINIEIGAGGSGGTGGGTGTAGTKGGDTIIASGGTTYLTTYGGSGGGAGGNNTSGGAGGSAALFRTAKGGSMSMTSSNGGYWSASQVSCLKSGANGGTRQEAGNDISGDIIYSSYLNGDSENKIYDSNFSLDWDGKSGGAKNTGGGGGGASLLSAGAKGSADKAAGLNASNGAGGSGGGSGQMAGGNGGDGVVYIIY